MVWRIVNITDIRDLTNDSRCPPISSPAGAATVVAVNSRFTAQVFCEAFARIAPKHPDPVVIYPAINLDSFVPPRSEEAGGRKGRGGKQPAALGACDGLWMDNVYVL